MNNRTITSQDLSLLIIGTSLVILILASLSRTEPATISTVTTGPIATFDQSATNACLASSTLCTLSGTSVQGSSPLLQGPVYR